MTGVAEERPGGGVRLDACLPLRMQPIPPEALERRRTAVLMDRHHDIVRIRVQQLTAARQFDIANPEDISYGHIRNVKLNLLGDIRGRALHVQILPDEFEKPPSRGALGDTDGLDGNSQVYPFPQ